MYGLILNFISTHHLAINVYLIEFVSERNHLVSFNTLSKRFTCTLKGNRLAFFTTKHNGFDYWCIHWIQRVRFLWKAELTRCFPMYPWQPGVFRACFSLFIE